MSRRNREYIDLLKENFNEEKYINFVKDLLNLSSDDLNSNYNEIKPSQKQYSDDIKYYKYFAKYNDGINNIGAFIVNIRSTNERNKQRNFIATLLNQYNLDASLVAFISENDSSWRISFVRKELSFTDKGIKQDLTPARRYSYLVGKNESVHTAQEYLLKLLDIDDRKININDIEAVFDVEKVTKKFFEEYKEQFLKLQEYLDKNEDFKTESDKYDFDSVEFAKRLMGQIVFLYFLQKKGWLGVQLVPEELSKEDFNLLFNSNDSVCQNLLNEFYELNGDIYKINRNELRSAIENDITNFTSIFINSKYDMPWGSGDKQFIRTIYTRSKVEHKNFFDDYLESFFYDGLNHKRDNQYFALFNCKIPFLNGGLFEPLNDYRWSSAEFNIPNKFFSNDDKTGILDFLDLYNFTIDEEEPLEKEIAVDPEMLGKIFENLLEINDRKSKGAFYTPREIVYYMCQESLANYLVNKVGTDYDETIQFIKYGDLISQVDAVNSDNDDFEFQVGKSILNNLLSIDNALENVKVADPAVGSGAFPLGILTEIVKIRNTISTYVILAHDKKIIRDEEFNNFKYKDVYNLKKETIENCIYAVDVELSAVDITKLRLWLSLIVDYPNNCEPKPLPNLDCKIMQGNSLVDEYEGISLFSERLFKNAQRKNAAKVNEEVDKVYIQQTITFDGEININDYIEKMLELQKQYFGLTDNNSKKELKRKIDSIQTTIIELSLNNDINKLNKFRSISQKRQKPWFVWKLEFYDVFKEKGGFDIVIGNPPYVDYRKIDNVTKNYLDRNSYCYKNVKTASLYVYFIEKGLSLCNSNGSLIYINPYQYLSADSGIGLRRFIFNNNISINKLIDVSNIRVFSSAQTYTCINMFSYTTHKQIKFYRPEDINNLEFNYKDLDYIKYKNNNEHKIILNTNPIIEKLECVNTRLGDYVKIFCGLSMTGMGKKTVLEEEIPLERRNYYVPFITTKDFDRNTYVITKYIDKKFYSPDVQNEFEKSEHIFIGRMTKKIRANILPKGIYCGKVNCIYNTLLSKKYIVSFLNSNLINYYYLIKNESKHQDGGYFGMDIPSLLDIPFIVNSSLINTFEKLYDEGNYNEINKAIFNLFNINDDEQKIIDDFVDKI